MALKEYAFADDVTSGETYAANEINFRDAEKLGTSAKFLVVSCTEGANLKVRFNGNNSCIYELNSQNGYGIVFSRGDFPISKIAFDNTASGGSGAVSVQLLAVR